MRSKHPLARMPSNTFSRRDFLKLTGLGLGSLAFRPFAQRPTFAAFPEAERLGRVAITQTELKSLPNENSSTLKLVYEDTVVPILKEIVGPKPGRINQRWIDTGEGYLWSPVVQPVRNAPNQPVSALADTSLGQGMWVEVTVPFIDLVQENPPARSPRYQNRAGLGLPLRLYYSQVTWVDGIKVEAGQTWYRLNEKYGSYGDIFWAPAEAFRPLTTAEVAPIHPEVENKRILVNIAYQTLSCFEDDKEIYFARVSSGALFNNDGKKVDTWATPLGAFPIWRKIFSVDLSGGGALDGWDLPNVGWVSFFVGSGVAIHSTYWHNNYGEPSSRGCVNCSPEDAKWIFRWTQPVVSYDPGDLTVPVPGGTVVKVVEH